MFVRRLPATPQSSVLWTRLEAQHRLACRPTARLRSEGSSVATGESVGALLVGDSAL